MPSQRSHPPVAGADRRVMDVLDRPVALDELRRCSALAPAMLRGPELPPGPGSIDAVALERAGMVDWSRTRSRISEEFRLVQRQILRNAFAPPGAEPGFTNLLMVTSARPGEGKSFTAINLAGSIARQGNNHVLLVDAELQARFDLLPDGTGGRARPARPRRQSQARPRPADRARRRSSSCRSCRSAASASAARYCSPRSEMIRLIQSLGRRYADRLLVLDAPPCLSTSDPAVLAPVVGQILFVVEAERTQRDEIEASLDLLQACPTIALVLNKQQISSRYTFGAYSSYYSS